MSKAAKLPITNKAANIIAQMAAQHNISEAEVTELKAAFDLFDTDQAGSIDTKGTSSS